MARVKKARVGIKLDMTPMVDVAFLLLTFFMTTTTFRPPEDLPVDIPDSHSRLKLPTVQVMTIIVDQQKHIRLDIESQRVRQTVFGPGFLTSSSRPVTLAELPDFIERTQKGYADLTGGGAVMNVILKADRKTDFEIIDQIIEILRNGKITTVNFMTNLELQ